MGLGVWVSVARPDLCSAVIRRPGVESNRTGHWPVLVTSESAGAQSSIENSLLGASFVVEGFIVKGS